MNQKQIREKQIAEMDGILKMSEKSVKTIETLWARFMDRQINAGQLLYNTIQQNRVAAKAHYGVRKVLEEQPKNKTCREIKWRVDYARRCDRQTRQALRRLLNEVHVVNALFPRTRGVYPLNHHPGLMV